MNCPLCNSPDVIVVWKNLKHCKNCKINFSGLPDSLSPAPPLKGQEDVFFASRKPLFVRELKTIEKLVPQKGKLLDIGCGYGYFPKLASEAGWNVEGLEIAKEAIQYCREVLKIKMYDTNLEDTGIPPNTYDVVTIWNAIEVIPNPRTLLNKIHSILKPGGILFIRVVNFSYQLPAFMINNVSLFRSLGVQPGVIHKWGVTAPALRILFDNAHLTCLEMRNSKTSMGDPYGSGGKMGKSFVQFMKLAYYSFAQLVFYASMKKLFLTPSIMAISQKRGEDAKPR